MSFTRSTVQQPKQPVTQDRIAFRKCSTCHFVRSTADGLFVCVNQHPLSFDGWPGGCSKGWREPGSDDDVVKASSVQGKRDLAALLQQHDPETLADIKEISAVFGPVKQVGYQNNNQELQRELVTTMKQQRNNRAQAHLTKMRQLVEA